MFGLPETMQRLNELLPGRAEGELRCGFDKVCPFVGRHAKILVQLLLRFLLFIPV